MACLACWPDRPAHPEALRWLRGLAALLEASRLGRPLPAGPAAHLALWPALDARLATCPFTVEGTLRAHLHEGDPAAASVRGHAVASAAAGEMAAELARRLREGLPLFPQWSPWWESRWRAARADLGRCREEVPFALGRPAGRPEGP